MGLREPWFEPLMQKSMSVRVTLAPDASTGVRG